MAKIKLMDRRSVLKAAGYGASTIVLGLPVLDAMLDGNGLLPRAHGQTTPQPVCLLTCFFGYGVVNKAGVNPNWDVAQDGKNFTLSPNLMKLADLKSDIIPITGTKKLASNNSPEHYYEAVTFSTASLVAGSNVAGGPSLEWVAGQHLSKGLRVQTIPAGIDGRGATVWSGRGAAVGRYTTPIELFKRVFSTGGTTQPAPAPLADARKSILDYVRDDTARLRSRVGAADKVRLDAHAESIRLLEKRLASAQSSCGTLTAPASDMEVGSNERVRLIMDLMVKAFECGVTRSGSFSFGCGGRQFPWVQGGFFPDPGDGNNGGHHGISHYRANDYAVLNRVVEDMLEQFAYMFKAMKAVRQGDTNLLHNSIVFLAAGQSGTAHSPNNMPVLLAGNAGGRLVTGRAIKAAPGTAYERILVSIMHLLGLEKVPFGDSQFVGDGPLPSIMNA